MEIYPTKILSCENNIDFSGMGNLLGFNSIYACCHTREYGPHMYGGD